MLEWLDALWSVFLEDQERIKKSVSVKSFSNVQPLQEFRCGARVGASVRVRKAAAAGVQVQGATLTLTLVLFAA